MYSNKFLNCRNANLNLPLQSALKVFVHNSINNNKPNIFHNFIIIHFTGYVIMSLQTNFKHALKILSKDPARTHQVQE